MLEQIKTTPVLRSIPVVVLSCSDSETDVARCLAAGANAFISKADNYEDFRMLGDQDHRLLEPGSPARRLIFYPRPRRFRRAPEQLRGFFARPGRPMPLLRCGADSGAITATRTPVLSSMSRQRGVTDAELCG